MKKLVKNPLDKELRIVFKGTFYNLKAGESKELNVDVVEHWKRLHGFLEVGGVSPIPVVEPIKEHETPIEISAEPSVPAEPEPPKKKGGRPKKIK